MGSLEQCAKQLRSQLEAMKNDQQGYAGLLSQLQIVERQIDAGMDDPNPT
jgi:uncharacterized protein involved in exopolysaccharide biosynthesis